jgi:tryptophan-rich sensory protein
MKNDKKAGLAVLFICVAFLPSFGAVFVKTGGWYEALNKPLWNPPAYVFGPVWTILYLLIGLAGYFAWTRGSRETRTAAITVWGAQLFVNALWSPLFFGLHRSGWAMASLVFLWLLVLLCIGLFSQRSRLAAGLMIPYFLWISFAGALNAAIMALN